MSAQQSRPPWWTKQETASTFRTGIQHLQSKYQGSSHLVSYVRKTAVLFVHSSNRHEGTLPRGFTKAETYQLLTEI